MSSRSVGELISWDDVGHISPASMDGHTRFFLFRDKRSRNNDSEAFIKCFEFVISYYESMGHKVKTLRSDYSSTFLASDLEVFRNKRDIQYQASSPHRHHQNAVERERDTDANRIRERRSAWYRTVKSGCMGEGGHTLGKFKQ